MVRRIALFAAALALAALLAPAGHLTSPACLAQDAAPQAAPHLDRTAELERSLQTEAEHHKFETLAQEYESLPSLWPDHYRPPKVFDEHKAKIESLQKELAGINFKALDNRDWVNYYVLRALMEEQINSVGEWRAQTERIAPLAPESQILRELRLMLFDMSNPASVAAVEKLAEVPAKIEEMKAKIKESNPGDLNLCMHWLERDARGLEEWTKLQSGTVPEFEQKYGESCRKALDAIKNYREYLDKNRKEWPPDPAPKRLGEKEFAATLRRHYLEFRAPKELEQLGWDQLKSTKAEMEALAKEIDPNKTLEQVFDEMKDAHPEVGRIAASYAQIVDRAREFLVKKDVVTIPEGWLDNVRVERYVDRDKRMPYAFYEPNHEEIRLFMSSEPLLDAKPEERDEKLKGHNFYSMFPVTVHETFPGHHVQFAHAAANYHVPQVEYYNTFLSEGWGMYCEQLMHELGFYEKENQPAGWDLDPRKIRLHQLRWRLHRAVRVIIDIGYQTENLSYDDAVKLMVNEIGIEEGNAKAEVTRFTQMPTQPMSYLIGYLDIMQLREDYKKMKGDKFNLKEFHDELLSYGSMPLMLIRAAMLGERDKVDDILQKN